MSNDTATRIGRRRFLTSMARAPPPSSRPRSSARTREVKVGYILPVTGPLAFEAQLALNGLLQAVDEINGAGGIKSLGGAQLVLLPGDTQNKVELGNSEAARLIDQGVTAHHRALLEPGRVLGPPGHREEQDAVPAPGHGGRQPARGRAALLLPHAAQRQGHGHADGGQHARDGQERRHPPSSASPSCTRTATSAPPWGTTWRPSRARLGYELVQRVPYNLRSPDFTAELSKVKAARPGPAADQRLLRRLQDHRGDRGQAPHRRQRPGRAGQCGLLESRASSPRTASSPSTSSTATTGTTRRARGRARCSTRTRSASTRSCPTTACRATRSCSCSRTRSSGRRSTDRDKVRDAIAKTNLTDHILTQDAIRFDDAGEDINATPALLQVQNGKPVVVGPARFAEAKPVFPVPKWKG